MVSSDAKRAHGRPVSRAAILRESNRSSRNLVIDADELATGNVLPQICPCCRHLNRAISLPFLGFLWCANRTAYGFRDHPETRYEARKNRPVCDMHTRACLVRDGSIG